jgi:AsmA protein
VTIGKLSVQAALWPLLHGNLVVHSLVLKQPTISLAVDRQGHGNWELAAAAGTAPPAVGPGSERFGFLAGLTLGEVKLVDGTLSYSDARSGQHYEADAVAATLTLPGPGSPLQARGSLKWRGQPVSFTAHVADPVAFLIGKSSAAEASIAAPGPTKLSFRGTLAAEKGAKAHGELVVEMASLRQFATWAGVPIAAPGSNYGAFKLAGAADIDDAGLMVRGAVLSLDAVEARGEMRIDRSRARPYLMAKLVLPGLDLNPYLPPSAAPSKGGTDLAPLRLADADLDLVLGPVLARGMRVDKAHLVAALKAGKLTADATDMVLYGGRGRTRLTLDATAAEPAFSVDAELSAIHLGPLLRATAGQSRVEGTASVSFRGSFRGGPRQAVMASLAGSGNFRVSSGSLLGGDLGAMLRNVQGAFGGGSGRTDFTDVSGSYTIRNGVLSNNNLQIVSSVFRASGRGTVALANTYVNYRIEPQLVSSGVGGLIQKALPIDVMVPIIVTGPIDNLNYQPDLAGAVKNLPAAIPGAIGNLPRNLPGGIGRLPDPGGIMRNLFGQ